VNCIDKSSPEPNQTKLVQFSLRIVVSQSHFGCFWYCSV